MAKSMSRARLQVGWENGGADGIRTHDLLTASQARSQLRHSPTAIDSGIE